MSSPLSDPLSWDGLRECPRMPSVRKPKLVTHPPHACPDGTVVVVISQWFEIPGSTLDRWQVGGETVDTSARTSRPWVTPDFAWFDVAHQPERIPA